MAHVDPPLSPGYRIELFGAQDRVGQEDVIELWEREGVVGAAEAGRRVHEVLAIGVQADDGLVAVSTAYLQRSRQLRMTFWYVRVFVSTEHRMGNLAFRLLLTTRDHLRELYESGRDTRAAGVMVEVQNRGLSGYLTNATWRSDFTFVGQNSGGDQMRVHYFPGAVAPLP